MIQLSVYLLHISVGDENYYALYTTRQLDEEALQSFVHQNWSSFFPEPMPEEGAIEAFFKDRGQYDIFLLPIQSE